MISIHIHTVGKCKESWLQEALAEYEKRLKPKAHIHWHLWKLSSDMTKHVLQEKRFIALDVNGELLSSSSLSKKLLQEGSEMCFVIGDAIGLPQALVEKAAWKLSLSPLTFTHQMTRLILLEQIYRAYEIDKGSKYHK